MGARRYTDQQFRDAVADPEVRTIADLCRRLGIVPRGGNYETLRRLAAELGVPLPAPRERPAPAHQHRLGPAPACSDDQLLAALEDPTVDGYPGLCATLGLRPHSVTYRRLRDRARALGHPLPASWSRRGPRPRGPAILPCFETEALATAVSWSRTRNEVLSYLGVPDTPDTRRRLAAQLERDGIVIRGAPPPPRPARPLEEILVDGAYPASTSKLRQRLVREGVLPARCARCRRERWEGQPIPLELDHIDGDRTNNTIENLRLLCPNCHALTPTYRGRNIGRSEGRQEAG